jgi:hypothetical protein
MSQHVKLCYFYINKSYRTLLCFLQCNVFSPTLQSFGYKDKELKFFRFPLNLIS